METHRMVDEVQGMAESWIRDGVPAWRIIRVLLDVVRWLTVYYMTSNSEPDWEQDGYYG